MHSSVRPALLPVGSSHRSDLSALRNRSLVDFQGSVFQLSQDEVHFVNTQVAQVYQVGLTLSNVSPQTRTIKLRQPAHPDLVASLHVHCLAPGLDAKLIVTFTCKSPQPITDALAILSQGVSLEVPICVRPTVASLRFSPFLNFGFVRVGGSKELEWAIHNHASTVARVKLDKELAVANASLTLSPEEFEVEPGKAQVVRVKIESTEAGVVEGSVRVSPSDLSLRALDFVAHFSDFSRFLALPSGEVAGKVRLESLWAGESKELQVQVVNNTPVACEFRLSRRLAKAPGASLFMTPESLGKDEAEKLFWFAPSCGELDFYSAQEVSIRVEAKLEEQDLQLFCNFVLGSITELPEPRPFVFGLKAAFGAEETAEEFEVSGEVRIPKVALSATSFDFGECFLQATREETFTVTNLNERTLTVEFAESANARVVPAKLTLLPHQQRPLCLRFKPKVVGELKEVCLLKVFHFEFPIRVIGRCAFGLSRFRNQILAQEFASEEVQAEHLPQVEASFIRPNPKSLMSSARLSQSLGEQSFLKSLNRDSLGPAASTPQQSPPGQHLLDFKKAFQLSNRPSQLASSVQAENSLLKAVLSSRNEAHPQTVENSPSLQAALPKAQRASSRKGQKGSHDQSVASLPSLDCGSVKGVFDRSFFESGQLKRLFHFESSLAKADAAEAMRFVGDTSRKPRLLKDRAGKEEKVDLNKLNALQKVEAYPSAAKSQLEERLVGKEMTSDELARVAVGPLAIDIGTILLGAQARRTFHVCNFNAKPIAICLTPLPGSSPASDCFQDSAFGRQILPAESHGGFGLSFHAVREGAFSHRLAYTLNGCHSFEFDVAGAVVLPLVSLSKAEVRFECAEDERKFELREAVQLTNPYDYDFDYEWRLGKEKLFTVEPKSGTLKAGASATSVILHRLESVASFGVRVEETLAVKAKHGRSAELKCVSVVPESSCLCRAHELDFKEVCVNKAQQLSVVLKNVSKNMTLFKVVVAEHLAECLSASPASDLLPADSATELVFTMHSLQPLEVQGLVTIVIRGSAPILLPVKAAVVYPRVSVENSLFDFGLVPVHGAPAQQILSIVSESSIPVELDLRLSDSLAKCLAVSQLDERVTLEPREGKAGKVMRIKVLPKAKSRLALEFTPDEIRDYDFPLPLYLAGTSDVQETLARPCKVRGVANPLIINQRHIDFGQVVIEQQADATNKSASFELHNPQAEEVAWEVQDSALAPFQLSKYQGRLAPNSRETIAVSFSPEEPGEFSREIQLFLPRSAPLASMLDSPVEQDKSLQPVEQKSTNQVSSLRIREGRASEGELRRASSRRLSCKAVPHCTIALRGMAKYPSLHFSEPFVVFPTVAVGEVSTATLTVLNAGYENTSLRHSIQTDSEVSLRASFPQGCNMGITKKQIRIELSFTSDQPVSFTAKLQLLDHNSRAYSVLLVGTADSSLFAIRDVRSPADVLQDCSFLRHYLGCLGCLPAGLDSFPQAFAADYDLLHQLLLYFHPAFDRLKPLLRKIAEAALQPAHGLKRASKAMGSGDSANAPPSQGDKADPVHDRGLPVLKESAHPPQAGVGGENFQAAPPSKGVSLAWAVFEYLSEVVKHVKAEGGLLCHVRPELLLPREGCLHVLRKRVDSEEAFAHLRTPSEAEFELLHRKSWVALFYQLFRCFSQIAVGKKVEGLSLFAAREKVLLGWLEKSTQSEPGFKSQDALEGAAEGENSFKASDSLDSKGSEEAESRSEGLLAEFHTGDCLAALLSKYADIKVETKAGRAPKEKERRCKLLLETFAKLGIDCRCRTEDVLRSSPREMLLVVEHLYSILPNYLQKGEVRFQCSFGQTVAKAIELTNPFKLPIAYCAKLEGSQAYCVEGPLEFVIEPLSKHELEVKYCSNMGAEAHATLTLAGKAVNRTTPSTFVFALSSALTSRVFERSLQVTASLYDQVEFPVKVTNIFPQDAELAVEIVPHKKTVLHQFLPLQPTLSLRKGETGTVKIAFVPLSLQAQNVFIRFKDSHLGEFAYELTGLVDRVLTFEDTLRLNTPFYAGKATACELFVPSRNERLMAARKAVESLCEGKPKGFAEKLCGRLSPGESYSCELEEAADAVVLKAKDILIRDPEGGADDDRRPEQKLQLEVTAKQAKKEGAFFLRLANASESDVRRYKVLFSASMRPLKYELEMRSAIGKTLVQPLPLLNVSSEPATFVCTLSPAESSRAVFAIDADRASLEKAPSSRKVEPVKVPSKTDSAVASQSSVVSVAVDGKAQKAIQIHFTPSSQSRFQASLKVESAQAGIVMEYDLAGIGEEPEPIRVFLRQTAQAEESHSLTIPAIEKTTRIAVSSCTLEGAVFAKHSVVTPEAPSFHFTASFKASGVVEGRFVLEADGQCLVFAVKIDVAPLRAGKVRLSTVERREGVAWLPVPKGAYSVSVSDQSLKCACEADEKGLEVKYYSCRPESKSVEAVVVNSKGEEAVYEVDVVVEAVPEVKLEVFKAELGKEQREPILLENTDFEEAVFSAKSWSPQNFRVEPGEVKVGANSKATMHIVYRPSCLELQEGKVEVTSDKGAKLCYAVSGYGLPQSKAEVHEMTAFVHEPTCSAVLFRNPLGRRMKLAIALESEDSAFTLLKRPAQFQAKQGAASRSSCQGKTSAGLQPAVKGHCWRDDGKGKKEDPSAYEMELGAEEEVSIPFTVAAKEVRPHKATLRLSAEKISWRYELKAVVVCQAGEESHVIRAGANHASEHELVFKLPWSVCADGEAITLKAVPTLACQARFLEAALHGSRLVAASEGHSAVFQVKVLAFCPKTVPVRWELSRADGCKWVYRGEIAWATPPVDDSVDISAEMGHSTALRFSIENRLKEASSFRAHIATETQTELTVEPRSGELPAAGKGAVQFAVTFKPNQYRREWRGRLVIQTDDTYWSYDIRAALPKYSPPVGRSLLKQETPSPPQS